jgi:hypothetical protein
MNKFYMIAIIILTLNFSVIAQDPFFIQPTENTIWALGQQNVSIQWDPMGYSGNVEILLYRFDYVERTISSSTPNDGSHNTWDVPSNLVAAANYRIRIRHTTAGWLNYSEYFRIDPPAPEPPTVETRSANNITSTEAYLRAYANANGATTLVWFEWGTSTAYGNQTWQEEITGTSTQNISHWIGSLTPNQTYHFRVVATNAAGTSRGDDESFTTPTVIQPPNVASFQINNGNASTTSRSVTLNNSCTNSPTEYLASENSNFSGATWQTYSTSPSFTLSDGNGTKTVYFKVKNLGGESSPTSDNILLSMPSNPSFTIRSVSNTSIDPNVMFYLDLTLKNTGAGMADHGGISVSFPQATLPNTDGGLTTYNSAQANIGYAVGTDFQNSEIHMYPVGELIDIGGSSQPAQYLLYEASTDNWGVNAEKRLRLGMFVKSPGTFRIYVRGWMTNNGYTNVYRAPSSSGAGIGTDQQTYYAYYYDLTINNVQPDLTVISISSPSDVEIGQPFQVSYTIKNQGNQIAGIFGSELRLSNDQIINGSDLLLDSRSFTSLGIGEEQSRGPIDVTISAGTASGNYYLGVIADPPNTVIESNETNNTSVVPLTHLYI